MEFNEDHKGSSSSSSSSSSNDVMKTHASPLMNLSKRKPGKKKFQKMRHPIYRGIRQKSGCKWVCEVREPKRKSRMCLGTFQSPEMAARVHDSATLALHGEFSPLNFSDSASLLRQAKSSSPHDTQVAAVEAATAFRSISNLSKPSSSSFSFDAVKVLSEIVEEKVVVEEAPKMEFVDEEALFNMPCFYNSMAEGLLITPPGMKKGFDWDETLNSDFDSSLWRN